MYLHAQCLPTAALSLSVRQSPTAAMACAMQAADHMHGCGECNLLSATFFRFSLIRISPTEMFFTWPEEEHMMKRCCVTATTASLQDQFVLKKLENMSVSYKSLQVRRVCVSAVLPPPCCMHSVHQPGKLSGCVRSSTPIDNALPICISGKNVGSRCLQRAWQVSGAGQKGSRVAAGSRWLH